MKRIQFRMKDTRDTRKECDVRRQMWQFYFEGRTPPHFPVPTIPVGIASNKDVLVMVHNHGCKIIFRSDV